MADVYFGSAQPKKFERSESLVFKLVEVAKRAGLADVVPKGENNLVVVKIHFGQLGGFRTIKPQFVGNLIGAIRECGGNPYLVDTWGIGHLEAAVKNGITYESVGAHILPTNGVKEGDLRAIKINGLRFKEVDIGGNVYDADAFINFAHAKGHGSCGYGGAVKNIALGCTSPKIRHELHSMEGQEDGARKFQEGMADTVAALMTKFRGKALHVNYICDIQPNCDCADISEPAFVPDIGIAASKDIASLEAATLDLINKAPGLPYSIAEKYNLKAGDNKFQIIHGKDPYIQVRALEKLGLGSVKYNLIEV